MSEATPTKVITRVKLDKEPRRDHRKLDPDSKRYIDRRRLLLKVPLSYPSIWKRMKAGTFPAPYIDGGKNVWDEAEVDSYLASLKRRSSYPTEEECPCDICTNQDERQ